MSQTPLTYHTLKEKLTTRPPTRFEARTEGLRSGGPRAACRLGWKSTRGPPEAARGHSPSLGLASGAVASTEAPPRLGSSSVMNSLGLPEARIELG